MRMRRRKEARREGEEVKEDETKKEIEGEEVKDYERKMGTGK